MVVKSSAGRTATCAAILLLTAGTQTASAVSHTVSGGETLWSIARRDGLSVSQLALANGLPADARLVAGRALVIPAAGAAGQGLAVGRRLAAARPPEATRSAQVTRAPVVSRASSSAGVAVDRDADSDPPGPAAEAAGRAGVARTATASATAGPAPQGGYTIRPGDTLSAIAHRSGVSVGEIAYMNGLDARRLIRAGTIIKLPTGAPTPTRASEPVPVRQVVPPAGPYPTPGRVSEAEVRSIAAARGVPPSLAAAIAWQESGFNNGLVSSANARGVMQLLPGTWDWVQRTLVGHPLDPRSPRDNVAAGVEYLRSLLRSTGDNPATAAAAYYQGLGSVRSMGLLPDTQRYVASVQTLMRRFGGR